MKQKSDQIAAAGDGAPRRRQAGANHHACMIPRSDESLGGYLKFTAALVLVIAVSYAITVAIWG